MLWVSCKYSAETTRCIMQQIPSNARLIADQYPTPACHRFNNDIAEVFMSTGQQEQVSCVVNRAKG